MSAVIGIDLGGTRIKAVALDRDGKILHQLYTPTNDVTDKTWKQTIAITVKELERKLDSPDFVVGISAPGIPDQKNSCISYMPGRLQGLENFDWSSLLNHKTLVINDAIAALMAEVKLGVLDKLIALQAPPEPSVITFPVPDREALPEADGQVSATSP